MTADHAPLSHHPVPHRDPVSAFESAFGLLGGPAAWFAQLCAGYAMASWPCFPREQHRLLPEPGYTWTWTAMVMISIAAIVISTAACLVSRRIYNRCQGGRTRFLALWGMIFGAAFAVGTAMTLIAFFVLPRCGG